MTIVATGGKTRMKILPLVILTPTALGLPPVNTMEKRMTQTATTIYNGGIKNV